MAEQTESPNRSVTLTEADARQLDAAYKPFPTFSEWSSLVVDTVRWDRYSSALEKESEASPDRLERARKVALRAAAIDTGAIEGLYEVDRGFTLTVAVEAAAWEIALAQKGEVARTLIESQISAYEYIVDFATRAEQITEAGIRELHAKIVSSQNTYRVATPIGLQEQQLPKGEYKTMPNHVRRSDDKIHSYAPVDFTPSEMHRLVDELRSGVFLAGHPVLQASYAHYALVAVHPFADGNGRLARALASVFLYRGHSIPLLILADQRREYFAALEAADRGIWQIYVDFTLSRALDAMLLVQESIQAGATASIEESLNTIKALYITKGGYTEEQVDEAGSRLLATVKQEFGRRLSQIQTPQLRTKSEVAYIGVRQLTNYRMAISQDPQAFSVNLTTIAPAHAQVTRVFLLQVPKDCGRGDDLILVEPNRNSQVSFAARIDEVIPSISSVLQIRINMWVEGLVARSLTELSEAARIAKSKG
jgi:Fic family protein